MGEDHAVDRAQRLRCVVDVEVRLRLQSQPHSRRSPSCDGGQVVADDGCGVVGHDDGELAGRCRWVEAGGGTEDPMDAREGGRGGLAQLLGQGRELVPVPVAGEQLVVEVPAQPAQSRETAGWLSPRRPAALVTFCSSRRASRVTSRFRSRLRSEVAPTFAP